MAERRVFILGAGFSACTGLPVAKKLFAEWMKWMKEPTDDDVKINREQLRRFAYIQLSSKSDLRSYRSENWHEEIDIEHLLTLSETVEGIWDAPFIRENKLMQSYLYIGKNFIDYFKCQIGLFMNDQTTKSDNSVPITRFCENLQHGDTIITFNWDTNIEKVRKDIYFGTGNKKSIGLLKLHGSIDWVPKIPDQKKVNKYIEAIDKTIFRIVDFKAYMNEASQYYVPILIPPAACKILNKDILNFWKQANEALFNATEVFIIGYSMPPTDLASLSLLRTWFRPEYAVLSGKKIPQKKLYVIDPDCSTIKRFQKMVSPKLIGIMKKHEEVDWNSFR